MGGPRDLVAAVLDARRFTMRLVEPLAVDDWVAQSMPDASPVKWHLAHTTWFFERFVLRAVGVEPLHPAYDYLFNSYYESVGERHPRPQRGLLTRPTTAEVIAYRQAVDARIADLAGSHQLPQIEAALELGLHHEQQHQELLLTDVKHLFGSNVLRPAYRVRAPSPVVDASWRARVDR
jgi:DinB superfamily